MTDTAATTETSTENTTEPGTEPGTEPSSAETPSTPEQSDPQDPQETDEAERPSNREGRYRRQLRDAEAERDSLRQRVETMQRAEAERLAGTWLSKPAALWAAGTELTDVLDGDGAVDPAKVAAAAESAATTLGAAAPRRRPRPDSAQGAPVGTSRANPWKEAFGRDKA